MVVKELFAVLGLDLDAASFAKGLGSLADLKHVLDGAIAVAQRVGQALSDVVLETAAAGAAASDAADRWGMSAQAAQELQYVTERAGLSTGDLQGALVSLGKNADAAAGGSADLAQAFARLGVSATDASGRLRPTDELLMALADGFAGLPPDMDRTVLAAKLFGDAGVKLLPTLAKGSEGLAELRAQAHQLGVVLDGDAVAASSAFGDALADAKSALDGLRNAIGAPLLVPLRKVLAAFTEWMAMNRELIASNVTRVLRLLGTVLVVVGKGVGSVVTGMLKLADGIARSETVFRVLRAVLGAAAIALTVLAVKAGLAAAGMLVMQLATMAAVAGGVWPLVTALLAAAAAELLALAPLVLLAAGFALLGALIVGVIDDLWTWYEGGQSVFGDFLFLCEELLRYLGDLFSGWFDDLIASWNHVGQWLADFFKGIADKVTGWVQAMVDAIKAPLDWLSGKVQGLDKAIGGAVQRLFGGRSVPVSVSGDVGPPSPFSGGAASPSASAQLAAGGQPATVMAPSQVAITVNATPGMSAEDVAGLVADGFENHLQARIQEAAAVVG